MNFSLSLTKASSVVIDHALDPGDAVVAKQDSFPLLDHFAIYMGKDDSGTVWFIGNLREKVQWLSEWDMEQMNGFTFSRVRPFNGSHSERQEALVRAKQALNEPYRFLGFNCEHFANWVQNGKASSQQVAIGGAGAAVVGFSIAAKSKNKWAQTFGIGLGLFGSFLALKEL